MRPLRVALAGLAPLLLVAGLVGCSQRGGGTRTGDGSPTSAVSRYPSSMDALGASTTRGFNTDCPDAWTDCPGNSWSTGTNPAVGSIYLRLLTLNPRLRDNNHNDAVSGSTMADLDEEARSAVGRKVELVTIAMGTNDACGGPDGVMSPIPVFRAEFTQAMESLTTGLPEASIRVVSIPDIYQIWDLFHTNPDAVKAWGSAHFCDTLLDKPTSNAKADVGRRAAVRAQVVAFNTVLAEVCRKYPRCKTDGGAAFQARVSAEQVSTNDYWHPSIAGQAHLAMLVWRSLGY